MLPLLGEPLPKEEQDAHGPLTEYDKLVQAFYSRLLEQRRQSRENEEKNRQYNLQKVMQRFPGWNELTISNLHSLFLLFDQNLNGMLNFDDLYILKHLNNVMILHLIISVLLYLKV